MHERAMALGLRVAPRPPIAFENRKQYLVESPSVLDKRLPQDGLLHSAHLQQRAVAAAVLHGATRLEPTHIERIERKLEEHFGAFLENAGSPESRPDGEAPFGRLKSRFAPANLEDPNRRVEPFERHGKA